MGQFAAPKHVPVIDNLLAGDYDGWLPLWLGNNSGKCDEAVTAETWARLMNPSSPVHGLCARMEGRMAGLVHYILHPVTGHIEPACYMQDLYVDPAFRRRGIGRMLVQALAEAGRHHKWARLYWLAEADNPATQALYKDLAVKLNFSLYVLPLR